MINFLTGIIFIVLILPILENIMNIINYLVEYIDVKIAYKIYLIKEKIPDQEEGQDSFIQNIGFQVLNEILEENEDEE